MLIQKASYFSNGENKRSENGSMFTSNTGTYEIYIHCQNLQAASICTVSGGGVLWFIYLDIHMLESPITINFNKN